MKTYNAPKLEVIKLNTLDVLISTASGEEGSESSGEEI